jgi:hypothetical protein
MVLVTGDHLFHAPYVVLFKLRDRWPFKEICVAPPCAGSHEIMRRPHHSDCRHFVYNKEAFLVRHPVPGLIIGIVAGAEAVRPRPFHAFKITLDHGSAWSSSENLKILMLAEPLKIYRFSVYKDMSSFYINSAYADAVGVTVKQDTVFDDIHLDGVKV